MLSRLHLSLVGVFALTVLSAIVVVACSNDPTGIDQGTNESNLDRHGYGYGYGYGASSNIADDRAP